MEARRTKMEALAKKKAGSESTFVIHFAPAHPKKAPAKIPSSGSTCTPPQLLACLPALQRPSGKAPIFRVRLRVIEVLRGPQDLLGQKVFTLVSTDADHPLRLVIHRVLLGEQCKLVLYKERDGFWYDMGLVDPREKHDPWLAPPRLFEAADRQWFAFVGNKLRELRESEKLRDDLHPATTSVAPSPPVTSAISWYAQVVNCSAALALMLAFLARRPWPLTHS